MSYVQLQNQGEAKAGNVLVILDPLTGDCEGLDLPSSTGDVDGPASATDNAIPRFDGITGKIIQGSSVIIDDSNNITGAVGITAAGDLVCSGAGRGIILSSTTATDTAANGITLDGRSGAVIFTSISIAAGADLTMVLTNSSIANSATQVIYSWNGATTSSALSIKSAVRSAGSMTFVFTNGTGAETSTANIEITFLVIS